MGPWPYGRANRAVLACYSLMFLFLKKKYLPSGLQYIGRIAFQRDCLGRTKNHELQVWYSSSDMSIFEMFSFLKQNPFKLIGSESTALIGSHAANKQRLFIVFWSREALSNTLKDAVLLWKPRARSSESNIITSLGPKLARNGKVCHCHNVSLLHTCYWYFGIIWHMCYYRISIHTTCESPKDIQTCQTPPV